VSHILKNNGHPNFVRPRTAIFGWLYNDDVAISARIYSEWTKRKTNGKGFCNYIPKIWWALIHRRQKAQFRSTVAFTSLAECSLVGHSAKLYLKFGSTSGLQMHIKIRVFSLNVLPQSCLFRVV